MAEFVRTTQAQIVIWSTALLILAALGVYVALWFRRRHEETRVSSSELLTEFRELRDRGNLSPAEFQKIKSVLGDKLYDDLSSKDAEGMG